MAREHWRDEDERERRWREARRERDDFGQADYSDDYVYDPHTRSGHRVEEDLRRRGDYGQADYGADWVYDEERDRAHRRYLDERYGTDRRQEADRHGHRRRRGPSDRVLWAVIMERLEDERRLDLRDVDVSVEDGEVTLNGAVRRKEDKRRIEDIADIEGVWNVQNNLRVRDRARRWTFL